MDKRPPQTLKEQAFAREYLQTGNATEAASRVYDVKNRDVARNIGSQNVAKLSFDEYFNEVGLDDTSLAVVLAEATKATKSVRNTFVPDWNVRLKAVDTILRLKGAFSRHDEVKEDDERALQEAPQTEEEEDAWYRICMRMIEINREKRAEKAATA